MNRIVVTILLMMVLAVPGAAQDGASRDWSARLQSLRPTDPMAYLELGEEVADLASTDEDVELARRLYSLAGILDPGRLGRSACLALAQLEETDHLRRRWLALAALLDESAGVATLAAGGDGVAPNTSAVDALLDAFSAYRSGRGNRALAALREDGATELLERWTHLVPGGAARFIEDCRLYRTNTRPPIREGDITTMLRLEIALLDGAERSWSAELLAEGGLPLLEVDPERLAESLGVDPEKSVWRNGRWVRP